MTDVPHEPPGRTAYVVDLERRLKAWENAADEILVVNWIGVYDRAEEPGQTLRRLIEHALDVERDELRDTLLDVLSQACGTSDDGALDSLALSAYADGLRLLAKHKVITIEGEVGRRVIARVKEGSGA